MSRSEDYLDQLLKGVSPEDKELPELEQDTLDENIFSDILEEFADEELSEEESDVAIAEEDTFEEDDIFGNDDFLDDDFLKEFELEMAKLEEESEETENKEDVLSLFDDLDSILSGAKEQMDAVEPAAEIVAEPEVETDMEAEPVIEENIAMEESVVSEENNAALEAFLGTGESETVEEPASVGGFSLESLFADDSTGEEEASVPQEDADVLKILEGLEGIDLELEDEDTGVPAGEQQDFSALEGFLASSATESNAGASEENIESFAFEESPEEAGNKKEKKAKKKKAGEKTGFMNKLGLILFGEDDEDEEEEPKNRKKNTVAPGPAEQGEVKIGEASEDELKLFGDYSGETSSAAPAEETPKKPKKEKKKKEKKEKVKKEKKPRPKKEKKPKKPKEPDNTPPLPKKPVFLIFLMVGSLLALIIMGADLLGYSNQMTSAKNQYAKKNYSEAFAEISGMEIKEEDLVLYNKYHVMAMVSVELEAYESLMEQEFYDMALDCLVRTVGRAEKYRADAEIYGCIQELNELELEAEEILSETFGVSREEALEFYAYRSKKEYSVAIANVIKELGLEKVTE